LAQHVLQLTNRELRKKNIYPESEEFFNWEVENFSYTKSGVKYEKAKGNFTNQAYWGRAYKHINSVLTESSEFKTACIDLKKAFPSLIDPTKAITNFSNHILSSYFKNLKRPSPQIVNDIQNRLNRDLNGEPLNCKLVINIGGIILESFRVKLNSNVTIRQTIQSDLEHKEPYYGLGRSRLVANHSAVLEINLSCLPNEQGKLQLKVGEAVALLRLFNVGNIRDISYTMSADEVLVQFLGGQIVSGFGIPSDNGNTYFLNTTNELKLKFFYNHLSLPQDIYNISKKFDHTTIAFERYSDALMGGPIERGIMNAVMGLEALFSNDSKELTFKLTVRVCRVLSFLNVDPIRAKEIISKSYDARSAFAHGGHLSDKNMKKMEKYGGANKVLLQVLDYLRIGIICLLTSGIKKDTFIDLVDKALISEEKSNELKLKLLPVRKFI